MRFALSNSVKKETGKIKSHELLKNIGVVRLEMNKKDKGKEKEGSGAIKVVGTALDVHKKRLKVIGAFRTRTDGFIKKRAQTERPVAVLSLDGLEDDIEMQKYSDQVKKKIPQWANVVSEVRGDFESVQVLSNHTQKKTRIHYYYYYYYTQNGIRNLTSFKQILLLRS